MGAGVVLGARVGMTEPQAVGGRFMTCGRGRGQGKRSGCRRSRVCWASQAMLGCTGLKRYGPQGCARLGGLCTLGGWLTGGPQPARVVPEYSVLHAMPILAELVLPARPEQAVRGTCPGFRRVGTTPGLRACMSATVVGGLAVAMAQKVSPACGRQW